MIPSIGDEDVRPIMRLVSSQNIILHFFLNYYKLIKEICFTKFPFISMSLLKIEETHNFLFVWHGRFFFHHSSELHFPCIYSKWSYPFGMEVARHKASFL